MSTLRISLSIEDTATFKRSVPTISVTTAAPEFDYRIISIATSEATYSIPSDITAPGYLFLRNMDATNYVQVGFATTVYHIRLLAGQVALLPIEPGETDLFLKSNTAACDVEIYLRAS